MNSKKLTKLKRLLINRVDLVPRGCNQEAHIMLYKGEGVEQMKDKIKETIKELPIEKQADVIVEFDTQEKLVKELQDRVEELEKALEDVIKSDDEEVSDEDVLKGLPEGVRERLEKAEKEAEENRAKLEKMENERIEKEFIAKAEEFENLPVEADKFGLVLKAISEIGKEEYETIVNLLKSLDEVAEKSDLFKSLGSDAEGEIVEKSAEEKLDEIAKAMAEKEGISYVSAYAKALDENPKLYKQYVEETKEV